MTKVKTNGKIDMPAEKVWETVRNFGALDEYVEAIASCKVEGSGVGSVRILTLQDGGEVHEKLQSLDDEKRLLTYSILSSPLPIRNYTSKMQVKVLSDKQSEFIWSSEFDVQDAPEQELKEAFKDLYSTGVQGLQKKFSVGYN
ncbi:MAG: SRPBCC family protein [Balneolaceae bacterium]